MQWGGTARTVGLSLAAALLLWGCGGADNAAPEAPAMGTPVTLTPPDTAFPEAPLTEENRAQLGAVVTGFLIDAQLRYAEGFAPAPETADVIVPLYPQTDHRAPLTLQGGRPYRFIGSCDFECSNMDLELLDAAGRVVARDLMANDTPIVDYTPPSGGAFTLRMIMQTCTITPCYAGARTLTIP